MRILGFQKTTLLDYPHKIASTIFIGGCNLRCPFCHNAQIVTQSQLHNSIPEDEILIYLKKRVGVLEGVCVTGGEPTLSPELPIFLKKIKDLGYLIKLDTNGTNPTMVKSLVSSKLIDYVAMDIKNSPAKYALTTGCNISIEKIQESISFLMGNTIPYEFRTTVVKELHTANDFIEIGQWLSGCSHYYLQNFIASEHLIQPGIFSSYNYSTLYSFKEILKTTIPNVSLRGIEEC